MILEEPLAITDRFIIRRVQLSDARCLARQMNDQEIVRNFGTGLIDLPVTESDVCRRMQARRELVSIYDLCIEIDEEPAGAVELSRLHRGGQGWIAYWLGRRFWGRGIMTQAASLAVSWAFEAYALEEMVTTVKPWNEPSKKVLQKVGFVYQGLTKPYYDPSAGGTFYMEDYKIEKSSVRII